MRRLLLILLPLLIGTNLLMACAGNGDSSTVSSDGTYLLDKPFVELYQNLGGVTRFGPAISPVIKQGSISYQYTIAALFQYDEKNDKVSLAPIGRELGIRSIPATRSPAANEVVIDGIPIFPPFVRLFEQLGGVAVVGNPISEVRYNEMLGRYEQYFENIGFYQLANDPLQNVYLLSYGAWMCKNSCTYPAPQNSRIDLPVNRAEPFVQFVSQQGVEFSGYALTEPYLTQDGMIEQVYENLVLAFNPEHPDRVILRPIVGILELPTEPLEKEDDLENTTFIAVDGKKGYNIPIRFMEYLDQHDGIKLSGMPVSRIQQLDDTRQRQCFEKLCLEDTLNLSGEKMVRPVKLGYDYRKKFYNGDETSEKVVKGSQIIIRPWETDPIIPPEERQEIGANIFSGNEPVSGVQPELIVTHPSGEEEYFAMPPTSPDGKTQIKINPISGDNGTLIPYRICVDDPQGQRFCVKDSFILWKANELRTHVTYLPAIFSWIQKYYFKIFLPVIFR